MKQVLLKLKNFLIGDYYIVNEKLYEEFSMGNIIRFEGWMSKLQFWIIAAYCSCLFLLSISQPRSSYINNTYNYLLLMFVVVYFIDYLIKFRTPRYSNYNYKVLRIHGYLVFVTVLSFLGKGSDYNLLLYMPILIFTGIFIGPIWSGIVTLEVVLFVYDIFSRLNSSALAFFPEEYIQIRLTAMFIMGFMSTYFWLRQQLYQRRYYQQEDIFRNIAEKFASALDSHFALDEVVGYLRGLIKSDTGLIVIDKDGDGIFTPVTAWGYSPVPNFRFSGSTNGEEGITGIVIATKKPKLIEDVLGSGIEPKYPYMNEKDALRSYLGMPIIYKNSLLGVLILTSRFPGAYNQYHKEKVDRLSHWLAISLYNTKQKNITQYLDQLLDGSPEPTIIANRKGYIEKINNSAMQLLGYEKVEEIRERNVINLWGSENEARKVFRLMEEGKGFLHDYEGQIYNKRGEKINVVFSGRIIYDHYENGKWRATIGYFHDTTKYAITKSELDKRIQVDSLIANVVQHENSKEIAEGFMEGAVNLLNTDSLHIRLLDESSLYLDLLYGKGVYSKVALPRKRLGEDISGRLVENGLTKIVVNNTEDDDYTIKNIKNHKGTALGNFLKEYHSYMAVPLKDGSDVIGTFHAEAVSKGFFDDSKQEIVTRLADRIGPALHSAFLLELKKEQSKRLNKLSEVTQNVLASNCLDELYYSVTRGGASLLRAEDCSLFLMDSSCNEIELVASSSFTDGELPHFSQKTDKRYPISSLGIVAATGEFISCNSDELDIPSPHKDEYQKILEDLTSIKYKALMMVPIKTGQEGDPIIGVLQVLNIAGQPDIQSFSTFDRELIKAYANNAAGVIAKLRLREEAERRVKQLSFLQNIGSLIQANGELEKKLFYLLMGITMGQGIGFNRSMIFLVGKYRTQLQGVCAIGPNDSEDAKRIYEDPIWEKDLPVLTVSELLVKNESKYKNSLLNQLVKSIQYPINSKSKKANILIQMLSNKLFSTQIFETNKLKDDEFCNLLIGKKVEGGQFALVPLVAQEKIIGIIYVDNRFNNKPITEDDINLLSVFTSQLGEMVLNTKVLDEWRTVYQDVAHAFGTPTATIIGLSDILLRDTLEEGQKRKEYLQDIARSAEHLGTLMKEAVYLGYFERLDHPLELDWVSIEWVIENLKALNKYSLEKKKLSLTFDNRLRPEMVEIYIERDLMLYALQMIVDNSIKYTLDPNKNIVFRLKKGAKKGLLIEISDQGIGISQEEQQYIWKKNTRGDYPKLKQIEGTGNGLYVSRQAVIAHKGEISLSSTPNEGTLVSIWFPPEIWRNKGKGV